MTDTRTVHDPFLKKDVEVSNRLVDRLRGKYACGPVQENGEPEFGWRQFDTPPIQHEAADEIERLSAIQPQRMPDREAIARAIYDVETDWLVRGGIGIPLCAFEEISERDRNLHLAYADAVLALTRPECGEGK